MEKRLYITILAMFLPFAFMNRCFALELSYIDYELPSETSEKKISMDFSGAKLNQVLKIFSQQSGLNFIASADVYGLSVNLYLDNVPVEEALEKILSANNLTYELQPGSNIFIVKELKSADSQLITRTYQLKQISLPSSNLSNTFSESEGGADLKSNLSTGLIDSLKNLISSDGSIVEDPRTNSLIITDYPDKFPAIESTIAKLDIRIPQILIETEMLDISKEAGDHLGVKFAKNPVQFTGPSKKYLFPFDQDNALNDQAFTFGSGEYSAGTLSMAGLSFALEYLRNRTDTKNLARPRILTLNNQTANIQIKTDEAIGLKTGQNDDDGSEAGSSFERAQTGVFLTVTPQANVDTGEIIMAIEPKVSQARAGGTFGESTSFQQTAKDPEEISTRSVLRVLDGETIVIGGLLRHQKEMTRTYIPVLSKIPFLGAAFRHKEGTDKEREIIVFITPHIVKENISRKNKTIPASETLLREQDIPEHKMQEIEKELATFEKRAR